MNATNLESIDYALIDNNRRGRLNRPVEVQTDLLGHNVVMHASNMTARLSPDGLLLIEADSVWDFGTMAIDTPGMVRASLVHDAFCLMTGLGMLPWSARAYGDRLFREILAKFAPKRAWYNPLSHWHWARWAGVRLNSMTLARLQAIPYGDGE